VVAKARDLIAAGVKPGPYIGANAVVFLARRSVSTDEDHELLLGCPAIRLGWTRQRLRSDAGDRRGLYGARSELALRDRDRRRRMAAPARLRTAIVRVRRKRSQGRTEGQREERRAKERLDRQGAEWSWPLGSDEWEERSVPE